MGCRLCRSSYLTGRVAVNVFCDVEVDFSFLFFFFFPSLLLPKLFLSLWAQNTMFNTTLSDAKVRYGNKN